MAAPISINTQRTGFGPPAENDARTVTQLVGPGTYRVGFSPVLASPAVDANWSLVQQASGTAATSQANSNLVVTSGVTANAETIIRSAQTFVGDVALEYNAFLSQRIANNNFYVELVDVIGNGLAATVNSATSVTVTIPQSTSTNPYIPASMQTTGIYGTSTATAAQLVGQAMYIGAVQNISASAVPMRATIASASVSGGNLVLTFTVAGWPASGSGTVTLFGWNYNHVIYNGTTVTSALWDTQRGGWNNGDAAITTLTSASPGHVVSTQHIKGRASIHDQATTSFATGAELTQRATRVQKVPDDQTTLYLQIRSANGSTAPASTTTFTMGYVQVEVFARQVVTIGGLEAFGRVGSLPIDGGNANAVAVSGSVTASGTVTANEGTPQTGTAYNLLTTASTNAASIKASAGNLYALTISNPTATAAYIKIYDVAAAPTVGTTQAVMTIPIPVTSTTGGFTALEFGRLGLRFGTGIAIAVTGAAANSDTTASVAGIQIRATYL